MRAWITNELAGADLGDARLNLRMGKILTRLSERPGQALPTACKGLAEMTAAYRFFSNRRATAEKILAPHAAATLARLRGEKVALVIQDTTEVDFTGKSDIAGLGPLNWKERSGMFCHLSLAVTPERVCLGALEANTWARDPDEAPCNSARKRKVIEEKESHRWLLGYRLACALAAQAPQTQLISVADREGDIYEMFVAAQEAQPRAELLVRACQNRRLTSATAQNHDKLWEQAARADLLGEYEFDLAARPGRKARRVRQEIRAARVRLKAPWRRGETLPEAEINAVLAREIAAPAGEEPVRWLLLTTLPVESFAAARQVVEYYLCRWQIEVFFRVLKDGCRIEALQLQSLDRLRACLAMYLIVAWRTMLVTMLSRTRAEEPCTIIFAEEEWQSLYQAVAEKPAPQEPLKLGAFVRMLAGLGGYLGRKGDGPPGAKAIWIGLQQLHTITLTWQSFRKTTANNCV